MSNINDMLDSQITEEFDRLKKSTNEDEREKIAKVIYTLCKTENENDNSSRKLDLDEKRFDLEERQFNAEQQLKVDSQTEEFRTNDAKVQEEREDRKFRLLIAGIETGIPVAVHLVLSICGFNFEKTGNLTSKVFQNVIRSFKPNK